MLSYAQQTKSHTQPGTTNLCATSKQRSATLPEIAPIKPLLPPRLSRTCSHVLSENIELLSPDNIACFAAFLLAGEQCDYLSINMGDIDACTDKNIIEAMSRAWFALLHHLDSLANTPNQRGFLTTSLDITPASEGGLLAVIFDDPKLLNVSTLLEVPDALSKMAHNAINIISNSFCESTQPMNVYDTDNLMFDEFYDDLVQLQQLDLTNEPQKAFQYCKQHELYLYQCFGEELIDIMGAMLIPYGQHKDKLIPFKYTSKFFPLHKVIKHIKKEMKIFISDKQHKDYISSPWIDFINTVIDTALARYPTQQSFIAARKLYWQTSRLHESLDCGYYADCTVIGYGNAFDDQFMLYTTEAFGGDDTPPTLYLSLLNDNTPTDAAFTIISDIATGLKLYTLMQYANDTQI